MTSLRISQLATRTGVPATTLRFYETAGLLPAARTPAGYRIYGQDAVRRLEFITSAKVLGLPLEEIRDLLGVWDRGVCAAVRDRMLPLVADRLAAADRRRAELAAFSTRLAAVHERLSAPAPAGACGPDCGCTTAPAASRQGSPVACTLDGPGLAERTTEWRRVAARATGRRDTADGVTLTFPAGPGAAAELAALAAAEQECCAFFDFTLHLTPTALELTVRAPDTAAHLLAGLFGADT
ncbi:MerR family transcriptional regulator [Umezawaea tangerina]|uniref:DNA-binding transcriptional MerR regulator n=1 Tax=Umezawaea tangerina TaxID=84725 RepID=A0A2T0T1X3_9PSEU|nr:MerR family transcriptional regulator [Umezawaea tangerina]PRY39649.1 DNA-binding transcriptional MerR regulator [Umezawaea tangerina]